MTTTDLELCPSDLCNWYLYRHPDVAITEGPGYAIDRPDEDCPYCDNAGEVHPAYAAHLRQEHPGW